MFITRSLEPSQSIGSAWKDIKESFKMGWGFRWSLMIAGISLLIVAATILMLFSRL
jgi:hypothetical protein